MIYWPMSVLDGCQKIGLLFYIFEDDLGIQVLENKMYPLYLIKITFHII